VSPKVRPKDSSISIGVQNHHCLLDKLYYPISLLPRKRLKSQSTIAVDVLALDGDRITCSDARRSDAPTPKLTNNTKRSKELLQSENPRVRGVPRKSRELIDEHFNLPFPPGTSDRRKIFVRLSQLDETLRLGPSKTFYDNIYHLFVSSF